MDQKIPVSICIMAKNEEHRIQPCLESVRWADEILVMDDESQDATVKICRDFGARVITRKMDIEGRHRNVMYAQAKNHWVLSLDADEHVTEALMKDIADVVKKNDPEYGGYSIPMKIFIGERWIRGAGYYPSARLKLFRRDKFRYEEAKVHPRVFLEGKNGLLKGELMHYSFRDLSHFISKFNRETDLEAEKWVTDKRRMSAGRAVYKSTDRFFRAYIGKKGWKDGFLGFILSCFSSWYQLVTYAKYRELKEKTPNS